MGFNYVTSGFITLAHTNSYITEGFSLISEILMSEILISEKKGQVQNKQLQLKKCFIHLYKYML